MSNKLHTVSAFDKELKSIASDIESMSGLVIGSINTFISNLSNQAGETVTKVREIDDKVNELERQVQQLATSLIALRNPMAVDLRYLIGAIKVSTIIERQGDMIESAVRKILRINPEVINKYKSALQEIAEHDIEMLQLSINGFCNQDVMEANKVWRMEDKADDLCDVLFDKIKDNIKKEPEKVDDYVSLMLVARSMERIADYCTNITKTVHYVTSGERVSEKDF